MDPISWVILGLGLLGTFSAFGQQAWSQDFSSSLQDDSQKFNAQQAEIDRDWQEEMYLKYNSLSGKIAQAKEAGVNPMLAVTGNATSPMSVQSAPASSGIGSAGSAPSSVAAITQLMDTLSNVKLKKVQAENIASETINERNESIAEVAYKNAKTGEAQALANEIGTRTQQAIESWNKKLDKLQAEIDAINANKELTQAQKDVEIQKKSFYEALASYHRWKADNAALHYWIETGFKALGIVTDLVSTVKNLKYWLTGVGEPTISLPDNPEIPANSNQPIGKYRPSYRTTEAEDFIEQLEATIGD